MNRSRIPLWRLAILAALLAAPVSSWAQAAGATLWSYATAGAVQSSPALGPDGAVFATSADGRLHSLGSDGTLRWSFPTRGPLAGSPAVAGDGTVYFGSRDKNFYAVQPNGTQQWVVATSGEIASSPAIGPDRTVYFGSDDHKIYAVGKEGTVRWTYSTHDAVYSSPVVDVDGAIYCGSFDQRLYALHADGTLKWSYLTGGRIYASPTIGPDGCVCFGSADGGFYALKPEGTLKWVYGPVAPIAASACVGADGVLYFAATDATLYALNPDGTLRWSTRPVDTTAYSSPACLSDGTIVFALTDGTVLALRADGSQAWSAKLAAGVSFPSPAVGDDGNLYLGANDGKIYALKGTAALAPSAWPMFHRDPGHSGSGFVRRELPAHYSPGLTCRVVLRAWPPAGATHYWVEERPPGGWTIGGPSHGGVYNANTGRLRFGPFLDDQPRTLSYDATPPLSVNTLRTWGGAASVNGLQSFVSGPSYLAAEPLHPADSNPVDTCLSLAEVTAYCLAWKHNDTWPIAPTQIPAGYVDRAIALWRGGGWYAYQSNQISAPAYWVNRPPPTGGSLTNWPPSSVTFSPKGSAQSVLPNSFVPGQPLDVTLVVAPHTNTLVFAVEDAPPAGWQVLSVSHDGVWDPYQRHVLWGPFFDSTPRSLTYRVVPPAAADAVAAFQGVATFDTVTVALSGGRQTLNSPVPLALATRRLPGGFAPGVPQRVGIEATPLSGTAAYLVEDIPPSGWLPGAIGPGGVYSAASGTVIFGPFFDDRPRPLVYEAIPPANATGPAHFSGTISTDVLEAGIGGDTLQSLVPFHPADTAPADNRLTISELTAYGALWKTNSAAAWTNLAASLAVVSRAVSLWRQGEGYAYDVSVPAGAPPWVSNPPAWFSAFPATNALAGDLSTAVASLTVPTEGGSAGVSITVTPATAIAAYALEDSLPPGWTGVDINAEGVFDAAQRKVKWGPFFDSLPRVFRYRATPGATASNPLVLSGLASFDGGTLAIGGDREADRVIPPAPPELVLVGLSAERVLQFEFACPTGQTGEIQFSTDLLNWATLSAFTNTAGGPVRVADSPTDAPQSARFYRVKLL